MRRKLFLIVMGIIALLVIFLCFRMDALFVDGALEVFLVGVGVGLVLGIILTVWIARKVDEPEDSRGAKA